jgi:hypothetical protein
MNDRQKNRLQGLPDNDDENFTTVATPRQYHNYFWSQPQFLTRCRWRSPTAAVGLAAVDHEFLISIMPMRDLSLKQEAWLHGIEKRIARTANRDRRDDDLDDEITW